MQITASEAAAYCGGTLIAGDGATVLSHISLNSQKMRGNDLFVPIIGERVDAHRFIAGAFESGAVCALSARHQSREDVAGDSALANVPGLCLIAVEDTREALQRMARAYRREKLRIPLIGVTGSVGKTTTREMIACALSANHRVYATKGNSNSQVGVPVTVLEADLSAQIGVMELGMSEFGEMHRISEVACADAAVITNIGVSHISQLGSQENIMKEKLHILDGMPDGAPLFLNGDDPFLSGLSEAHIHALGIASGKKIRPVFYGTGENADWKVSGTDLSSGFPRFTLSAPDGRKIRCALSVAGMHMVLNAAAAIAAAAAFGTDPQAAADALASFGGVGGRGEVLEKNGVRIIDDSYNAAPASMKAGLEVLCGLPAEGKRIAVLADMLELGDNEAAYHREVGSYLREKGLPVSELFLYGPLSLHIAEGASDRAQLRPEECRALLTELPGGLTLCIRHFESPEALKDALFAELSAGDSVLFKGSNAMGLSKIVKELLERESE